jgi:glutamyl-tRNA synthetase
MLAVVIDDHDMNITHVIRGVDHLQNTAMQIALYNLLNWSLPTFAHIPLIHDADGHKLSKRKNPTSLEDYISLGILPEAMCNYLLKLSWGKSEEKIDIDYAIKNFKLTDISSAPARFDLNKLYSINKIYLKDLKTDNLLENLSVFVKRKYYIDINKELLARGINGLLQRSQTLEELYQNSKIYLDDNIESYTSDALDVLHNNIKIIPFIKKFIISCNYANIDEIKNQLNLYISEHNYIKSNVFKTLRSILAGNITSPDISEILYTLGKEKSILRLKQAELTISGIVK